MIVEPSRTMDNSKADADSDNDTLTSSDGNPSDDNISDRDADESDDDTESYRSLAFSVQSDRSTATVKSKKTKKRVQFKPGESLVLVYIIPNREMLGLKSESEDSDDSDDDGDDSDDEEDDDSEEESDEDDDDEDEEDEEEENKTKARKQKPFARLMAVKQVKTHLKKPDRKVRAGREKNSKLINLNINHLTQPPRRNNRTNRANRKRERKERTKSSKKDSNDNNNKSKQGKSKRNTSKLNVINVDMDKNKRSRRNKPGILEIKATVQGENKQDNTTASVPKLMYKNDLKPSVVNVNGALTVCQTKLLQRSKLQPMALRVSKVDNRPNSSACVRADRQANVRQVMSTSYDCLTSLLPDSYSYSGFRHSLSTETLKNLDHEGHSPKDYIKRLDPGNMTDSSKRHYAWQVANGTISSQSLRTPSILPFWDSLKPTVPESNTVKLPL